MVQEDHCRELMVSADKGRDRIKTRRNHAILMRENDGENCAVRRIC